MSGITFVFTESDKIDGSKQDYTHTLTAFDQNGRTLKKASYHCQYSNGDLVAFYPKSEKETIRFGNILGFDPMTEQAPESQNISFAVAMELDTFFIDNGAIKTESK